MSQGSARWSDRPTTADSVAPGQPSTAAVTGPESMSSDASPRTSAAGTGRVSERRLAQLAISLSVRDRAILRDVAEFGFLTTHQVEALHFAGHQNERAAARICRRVLARLEHDHLIERLTRRVGGYGAGSSANIWRLGVAGDRMRRREVSGARLRFKEPSLRFLDHRLAVAQTVVDLTIVARGGQLELCSWHTEPQSWRRFSGGYGEREQLKPDLFVVTASDDYEDHWFIEIDRATESLPTVLRKCEQYERYRRTGKEQAGAGLFPRVIWLVPDEVRRERLHTGIGRAVGLDSRLFVVAVSDQLSHVIKQTEGGEHA